MSINLHCIGNFADLSSAPRDGTLVVGRDGSGETYLMRWRSRERILEEDGPDDQRPPYWARWHSDEPVTPVVWAATSLQIEDVVDQG